MSSDFSRVAQTLELLRQPAEAPPSLEDLAARLGLSPGHFQRMFTRYAGVSPTRVRQYLAMQKAQGALEEGASVLDAAMEAGLSGPGRLHDLFVTVSGLTPGEYKRQGQGLTVVWGLVATPFSPALGAMVDSQLTNLAFGPETTEEAESYLHKQWPVSVLREDREAVRRVVEPLFAKWPLDEPRPLAALVKGTRFQILVWEALLKIPYGVTTTYGEIAAHLGRPGGSRAVGQAVGANPIAWVIPCHRVIRESGLLGGYRWGCATKQRLLEAEGMGQGAFAFTS